MNIDISDEMIERIVEKQVTEKVKEWFSKHRLNDVVNKAINEVVKSEIYIKNPENLANAITEEARKITKAEVIQGVCERISEDIAGAYADKFGKYY